MRTTDEYMNYNLLLLVIYLVVPAVVIYVAHLKNRNLLRTIIKPAIIFGSIISYLLIAHIKLRVESTDQNNLHTFVYGEDEYFFVKGFAFGKETSILTGVKSGRSIEVIMNDSLSCINFSAFKRFLGAGYDYRRYQYSLKLDEIFLAREAMEREPKELCVKRAIAYKTD